MSHALTPRALRRGVRARHSILHFSSYLALVLAAFTLVCRWCTPVADAYATRVYPVVSAALSWVAGLTDIALQEIVIAVGVAGLITALVVGWRKRAKRNGAGRTTRGQRALWAIGLTANALLWTYVWFYMAWCINYSRSSLLVRTASQPVAAEATQMENLARTWIDATTEAWTSDTVCDRALLEREVKAFYSTLPARYGLAHPRQWQHPKASLLTPFYSAVGVQGFMAPLLAESCINPDVPETDYPYVYAHELSHLLGVSSEAEAGWWALYACLASDQPAAHYSARKALLPHVMANAGALLEDSVYTALYERIDPRVLADLDRSRTHWASRRNATLDAAQHAVYDLFLRSNKLPAGTRNYSQVVQLLLAVEAPHE